MRWAYCKLIKRGCNKEMTTIMYPDVRANLEKDFNVELKYLEREDEHANPSATSKN